MEPIHFSAQDFRAKNLRLDEPSAWGLFLLQEMNTYDRDIQLANCENKRPRTLSPTWGVFIKSLFSGSKNLHRRGSKRLLKPERMDNSKETVSDTHIFSETEAACI